METNQINREQMYLQIIFEKNTELLALRQECERLNEELQKLQEQQE